MPAFTILTDSAQQKLQEAQTTGVAVTLTTFVVGDGGGLEVTPDASQTALVNQVFSAPLNSLTVDQQTGYLYARGIIPADEGGFTVREVGILDSDGELFAVGKTRNIEKPSVGESDISEVVIDIITDITNAELVEIQIDPSVVLATLADINQRGLPPGGLTDYVLKKSSNQDYDAEWFDPAAGLNINVLAVVESVTLADSQTVVTFNTVGTAGVAVYIEGAREFGFTVDSPTQITLDTSYPAGTQLWAVQNEPAGTISAAAIAFTDTNNRFGAATDVQDVIDQLGEASKRAVGTSAGNLQQVGAFGGPTGAQTYWHSGNFTPGDYVEFAEFSTFGYDLIQAANAAAGRTLLNLGTAATRNVGTGNGQVPDYTAAGLSGFGYGSLTSQRIVANDATRHATGFIGYDSASSPYATGVLGIRVNANAAGRAMEFVGNVSAGGYRFFGRAQFTTDTWSAPVEFYTNSNLSPVTTNTTQIITGAKTLSRARLKILAESDSARAIQIVGRTADGIGAIYFSNTDNDALQAGISHSDGELRFSTNNVVRQTITSAGDCNFTGTITAPNVIATTNLRSDPRLKTNRVKADVTRQQLDSLTLWYFEWRQDRKGVPDHLKGKHDIGVMADAVQKVFPECVVEHEGYLTVDYAKLGVCLTLADMKLRREGK